MHLFRIHDSVAKMRMLMRHERFGEEKGEAGQNEKGQDEQKEESVS